MTEILHYTDVPFVLLLGEVEGVEVGVSGSAGVEEEDNCLSANRPRGSPGAWELESLGGLEIEAPHWLVQHHLHP